MIRTSRLRDKKGGVKERKREREKEGEFLEKCQWILWNLWFLCSVSYLSQKWSSDTGYADTFFFLFLLLSTNHSMGLSRSKDSLFYLHYNKINNRLSARLQALKGKKFNNIEIIGLHYAEEWIRNCHYNYFTTPRGNFDAPNIQYRIFSLSQSDDWPCNYRKMIFL